MEDSQDKTPTTTYEEPISDVRKAASKASRNYLKKNALRIALGLIIWTFIAFAISPYINEDIIPAFFIGPFLILLLLYYQVYTDTLSRFWKEFAAKKAWSYVEAGDPKKEEALMFEHGQENTISNIVSGSIDNRPLRIFSYSFRIRRSRGADSAYKYTVFGIKFSGHFPHLYLNYHHDNFNQTIGERISLPLEFEKRFSLFAPKEYEMEAHQIFSPSLLSYLLDNNLQYDLELVNGELLIFVNRFMNNPKELEEELDRAYKLAQKLAPTLDDFRFQEIGNYPTSL